MGALMRSLDWSQTPLGAVETWSQSLRSTLSICLNSRFPIAIYWGADFLLLYNDAWRPIVGDKHPWAIGRPAREVWSEIWDDIGPELAGVLATGEGTFHNDELLSMHRFGYTEECFFEYTFNPIQGQGGVVDGVFNVVSETTYRVLNERRARLLRETAAKTGVAKTTEEACALLVEALKSDPLDIPFALLYLVDSNEGQARLCGSTELLQDSRISPEIVNLTAEVRDFWEIARVVSTAQPQEIDDLVDRFGKIPGSPWSEPPQEAMVLPIITAGQDKVTGVLVAVASPRRRLDDNYRDFFYQIATQIATAIINAQAYEAERQRAEALAELDRAKTLFFSNVSHEFRTPLTLMLSPLEELSNSLNGQLQPEQWEQLQLIQRNGLRLQKLVNTLLDFSRIEAGRVQASYEPTDLAAYTAELASVFRSLIEQAGMALVIDCAALPEPVYVDRDMWEKIVLNLISNAFKFTFTGSITVRLHPAGNSVELSVTDTGVGIPEAELPRLFERFHRVSGTRSRTYEGSGIGLALVQELVKLHGGTIHVTSQVDCGTTFTISLPLGTQHLPQDRIEAPRTLTSTVSGIDPYIEEASRWITERSQSSVLSSELSPELKLQTSKFKPQSSQTAHILLADDNADMRNYVKRLLSQGYEVETVSDGFAALEAMTQRLPDLVLSDVMMPRLDGFGLLRELRADPRTKGIPIILLSARAGEESRIEGLEAGADDYLVKPFSARELLARVESTLKLAQIRKQAETAIREREERLKLAVEAGRMIAWEWNPFTETIISTNLSEIYGIEMIDSSQQGFTFVHPDDQTRHQTIVENAVAAGSHYQSEFRFIRPDNGALIWMEERGRPVLNDDGILQKLVGVTIDITNRKQAENAIREGEERLKLAMEAGRMVAWEWNPFDDSLILSANFPEIYGTTDIPTVEQEITLLHPEDQSQHRAIIEQAVETRSEYRCEFRVIRPDTGAIIWLEERGQPILNEDGTLQKLIGVSIDITDRKQAEALIQGTNDRLKLLSEMTSELLLNENPQSFLNTLFQKLSAHLNLEIYVNYLLQEDRQRLRLVAYSGISTEVAAAAEFLELGQAFCGYVVQHQEAAVIQNAMESTSFLAVPLQALGIRAYASYPLMVNNQAIGTLGFGTRNRDCFLPEELELMQTVCDQVSTALQRSQLVKALQQRAEELAQANRIKDEFLAVLSHELRSPLNPILGWSKLLQNGKLDESKTKQALATIERNAKLQSELIEDLLDVSRILQGKLSLTINPVNLASTIQAAIETVRLAAEAKSIAIETSLDPEIGLVLGDSTRLQQIVWNLLSNAVKFTPTGGQVTVQLEQVEDQAQITVCDTGKGISPDFLPYVFDHFRQADSATTRKFGGLGLGLAIVRHLVELHGGTIQADSAGEGLGATFIVNLPLMPIQPTIEQNSQVLQQSLDLTGVQILVVDDETDTRDFVAFALEQAGATVIAVSSAIEAIAVLTDFKPNVLVSDIGMPDMDGYMLMRQIRALPPEQGGQVKAIALTAYAGELDQRRALSVGFQQHVSKPVEPEALIRTIVILLDQAALT
ncbi:ATP-binding protein [Leptolyngbya sp. DQ-M1]|uniref:ATP-binding protein n=1 Tax=Leptolyngbya sp. DQ-M1 TaxID=2933920 RepID=UPI00329682A5